MSSTCHQPFHPLNASYLEWWTLLFLVALQEEKDQQRKVLWCGFWSESCTWAIVLASNISHKCLPHAPKYVSNQLQESHISRQMRYCSQNAKDHALRGKHVNWMSLHKLPNCSWIIKKSSHCSDNMAWGIRTEMIRTTRFWSIETPTILPLPEKLEISSSYLQKIELTSHLDFHALTKSPAVSGKWSCSHITTASFASELPMLCTSLSSIIFS